MAWTIEQKRQGAIDLVTSCRLLFTARPEALAFVLATRKLGHLCTKTMAAILNAIGTTARNPEGSVCMSTLSRLESR
jgi:hypothetical protein